ncbi:MAG TPA: HEAT repeat domain-containing protein [Gemmatimonadaceae bacterium]|nr:HEAT repeat domain-containing protein [Gemmatimonadaceae bacterium]
MNRARLSLSASAVALALAGATPAFAQTLDSRVRSASGDVVQFNFAARSGVCGDGRQLLRVDGGYWTTTYGSYNDMTTCAPGPVRAVVSKDRGDVIRIQLVAGPLVNVQDAADLGRVSGADAARYFIDLANRLEGRPARTAVLAASLADSADVADALLAIARNPDRARELRSSALSWASRRAGVAGASRMATSLNSIATDPNERQTMRASALNGLSTLEGGAGVSALIALSDRTDDAWLAGEAADALSRTNDARVRPQLRRLLDNRSTPEASRVRVISALGNTDGTVRDAEALRAAYPRFTERERTAALGAIGNIGDRASISWLLDRAKDPAEGMTLRRGAAQRAARAGARASDLALLYDAVIERQLREVIVDALAEDGSRPALDKLLSIAETTSSDMNVRRRAISKLGESGDPRAKPLLESIIGR